MNANRFAHWLKLAYETAFKEAITYRVDDAKKAILRSIAFSAGSVDVSDELLIKAYENSKSDLVSQLRRTALLRHECVSRGIEVRE